MSLAGASTPHGTLILPVYDAAPYLARTLRDVRDWIAGRPEPWEVIVVDDASTDGTRGILDAFVSRDPGPAVSVIRFVQNRGKGFAVRAGLALARGKYVVFTDSDLAYPMENFGRILERLQAGADAAIACRVLPQSSYVMSPSFFSYLYTRHLMGRLFNAICRIVAVPRILDTQAGLKGFKTATIRPILGGLTLNRFSFDVELLRALLDRRALIEEVPVSYRYDSEPSTVQFTLDAIRMIRDLIRVRARSLSGLYRKLPATPASPRVVVNADDYGIAPGVNRAIQEGLAAGTIGRASILLGTPHAREALAWAARNPRHAFGVHLNLTLGRPVSPPESVGSLVDRDGRFHGAFRFGVRLLAGRVRLDQVQKEWEAQIAAVRAAGIVPVHLDSHQHVHLLPPLLRRVSLPLGRKEALPVRAVDGPVVGRFGLPDPKGLALALATRMGFAGRDGARRSARGFGAVLMRAPTLSRLRSSLARLRPDRAYELVVHPGYVDEELRATGDGYLAGREIERRFLASDDVRALLAVLGCQAVSKVLPQSEETTPQGPAESLVVHR